MTTVRANSTPMMQAQSISIYVPSGMRDLKLDLVAVTS
jgi:type VI secretion system protein ImpJ